MEHAGPGSRLGTMWCPVCGDEFRSGVGRCPDCRTALVADQPKQPQPEAADHESVTYELGDWQQATRDAMGSRLLSLDVPHLWRGSMLVIPSRCEDAVDAVVDELDDIDGIDVSVPAEPAADDAANHVLLASPWRRMAGFLVDSFLLASLLYLIVGPGGRSSGSHLLARFVAVALYEVVPVALWGRTVGKAVAGTVVQDEDEPRVPRWRQAGVRWAVPAAPAIAVILLQRQDIGTLGAVLSVLWTVAVYAGVLFDARRRGLHDRAARTVVLRRPRRAVLQGDVVNG